MKPKLIRDNIPNIIAEDGRVAHTRVLSDNEYETYLENKLIEEVHEYIESKEIDELADIIEVIYALLSLKSCSRNELDFIRQQKVKRNGAFEKHLLLYDITKS